MNKLCSLKQISEAVILSALDFDWAECLVHHDYPEQLKSLDNFIKAVHEFIWVFDKKFERIIYKYLDSERCVSQEEFVNFLSLRCEILSQKRDHFGLVLTCAFACQALRSFRWDFKCLHYDSPAYEYLSEFLQTRFKCLEKKSNWNSLMHYCKERNKMFCSRRSGRKYLPMDKSTTSISDGENVGNKVDESNRKSYAIKTGILKKIDWSKIRTKERKNSEHFNDDTDQRCDQSIEITQSKVAFGISQNKIEKNKTQEANGSYIGGDIAVNTTSFKSSEALENQSIDKRNARKRKRNSIETVTINKLGCPDIDTKEVKDLDEHLNNGTDKMCDEMLTIALSEVISCVSQNDKVGKNKTPEINDIEKNANSSPVKEIDRRYDTASSDESYDEHKDAILQNYNLLMPDPQYKLEIFGLLKKCKPGFDHVNGFNNEQLEKYISLSPSKEHEKSDKSSESNKNVDELLKDSREKCRTPVDEHKSDNQSDTKDASWECCKDCKGKNFNIHYQERKMAFKERYNNLNRVSDYFY